MPPPSEKRRFRRIPIAYEVRLIVGETMISFPTAIDLSMGGLLLDGSHPMDIGTNCGVAILLGEGEPGKRVVTRGTVVRADSRGIAIAFSRALDAGSENSLRALIQSLEPGAENVCRSTDSPEGSAASRQDQ